MDQNPNVDCKYPLPVKTVVNIKSVVPCGLSYMTTTTNTCVSISRMFDFNRISGSGSPNPYLNCSTLQANQKVCIIREAVEPLGPCTRFYSLKSGETCNTVIQRYLKGNATLFYLLNPGIFFQNVLINVQNGNIQQVDVCVASADMGSSSKSCKNKIGKLSKPFTFSKSASCVSITKQFFSKKERGNLRTLNGYLCKASHLRRLLKMAIPTQVIPTSKRMFHFAHRLP